MNPVADHYPVTSAFYIGIIWFMWFANQFFILIILLNFLIAVISQSYENVMSKAVISKYRQRAQLNRECRLVYAELNWCKVLNITILTANTTDDHGDEADAWQGVI